MKKSPLFSLGLAAAAASQPEVPAPQADANPDSAPAYPQTWPLVQLTGFIPDYVKTGADLPWQETYIRKVGHGLFPLGRSAYLSAMNSSRSFLAVLLALAACTGADPTPPPPAPTATYTDEHGVRTALSAVSAALVMESPPSQAPGPPPVTVAPRRHSSDASARSARCRHARSSPDRRRSGPRHALDRSS